MTTRDDDWIRPPPDEDYSEEMPPPERTPSPGLLPSYSPSTGAPQYVQPGREGTLRDYRIGSVGRRPDRMQPLAMRSPVYLDMRHAVFLQVRFELLPIPDHAMGVAYVNYRDNKWMFARRQGNYHVAYRSVAPPHDLFPPMRLSDFIREAVARVGTHRWNSSRWFYIYWDTNEYGPTGDFVL